MMAYPAGAIRLTAANNTWTPAFLHKDHLGSVRAISGPDGTPEERTLYRPYGAQSEVATATLNDDKSWLGERYDAGAGLQYLNARYYDPELAMFLQPDWFEVMQPGVGTNRYAYANGDPINRLDPGGNGFWDDFKDSLRDSWESFKDALSGDVVHLDNKGQPGTEGQSGGLVHVDGITYACFGCGGGSRETNRETVIGAMRYAGIQALSGGFGADPLSLRALAYTAGFPNSGTFGSPLGNFIVHNMKQYPAMMRFLLTCPPVVPRS